MARQWYYEINGKRRGPVDSKTLKHLAASGRLKPNDLVWTDGKDEWKPARIVVGLFPESVVPPPPPIQKKSPVPPPPPPQKKNTEPQTAESVPALWNPTAIRLWSLLFTWGFGGYLVAQNWKSLGEPDKAKKSMIWFYSIFGFIFLGLITPDDDFTLKIFRTVGLGVLAVWSIFSAQPQINYVKEYYGKEYPRRSWGMPIGIAVGSFVLLIFFIFVISFVSGIAGSDNNISIVRNGYLGLNQTISVGQAFESFFSNPEWEEIEAENGNQYVNLTGGMTINQKPVNAKLQFRVFPDTRTFKYQALTIDGVEQNDAMATNLIVTAFHEAGIAKGQQSSTTNALPASKVEEPVQQLPTEMVNNDETTISPSASQNGTPRIVATPFFSITSDYEFVYETLRFVPSTTMTPLSGIETRLHTAKGSVVSFLEDGTRVKEQVYRSSDGVLEMELGKGSDGSPQWAVIIPKNVKESDRWEHEFGSLKLVFECRRVSRWTSPPDYFTKMSGNALVEIEMRKYAEGMNVPFEAYRWTFVEPIGLVDEKYFIPTASSNGGRLSHIKTDTLKEIRESDKSP